jgi:hypothetical protein
MAPPDSGLFMQMIATGVVASVIFTRRHGAHARSLLGDCGSSQPPWPVRSNGGRLDRNVLMDADES